MSPPAKGQPLPLAQKVQIFQMMGHRNGIVLSVFFLASQASAQTNVMDPPPPGAMGMPAQPPIAPQPAMSESPAALGASGPSASPTTAAPASPTAAPPSRPSVPSGSAPSLAGQTATPPGMSPRPAPYSLPWGLRPIIPVTVLRLDTVVASYRVNDSTGVTAAIMPLLGYRFTPNFMGVARWGLIGNSAPDGTSGVSVSNIALGGIWGLKLPASLRLGFFLGATVPIGTGGAKAADPLTAAANSAGLYARSALDNAMFAVNDFTLFPGVDFAYVGHGLTVQVEATLLLLFRVKNEAVQTDAFRTNFTAGLHVGYFATKWLSLSTELRYQRWLSTPDAVAQDASLRDNLSLALGPRFHTKLGRGFLRPGIAYNVGLAGRLSSNSYHMVLIDIPYVM